VNATQSSAGPAITARRVPGRASTLCTRDRRLPGHRDSAVAVNTAARNNVAVTRYGQTLDGSLEVLDAKFVALGSSTGSATVWSFSRSLSRRVPRTDMHVVHNGDFGDEHKFELYNSSKLRTSVESRGGQSVTCRISVRARYRLPASVNRLDICAKQRSIYSTFPGRARRKRSLIPSLVPASVRIAFVAARGAGGALGFTRGNRSIPEMAQASGSSIAPEWNARAPPNPTAARIKGHAPVNRHVGCTSS
jgi:hypothetical protein